MFSTGDSDWYIQYIPPVSQDNDTLRYCIYAVNKDSNVSYNSLEGAINPYMFVPNTTPVEGSISKT